MNKIVDRFITATLGGLAAITIAGGVVWLIADASSKVSDRPKIEKEYKARGSGRDELKIMISSDEEGEGNNTEKKKRQKTEVAITED